MKQILLLPIFLALFLIPCLAQKSKPLFVDAKNTKDIQITNKDKAQIIKSILLEFDFLNRHLVLAGEKREVVYLSTENISPKFLPKISGINFVLVNPQEIKEKANTLFGYYAFEEFKVEDSKVLVSFSNIYKDTRIKCSGCAGSANSTHGIRYEFRKVSGKWQRKKVNGYASGS